MDRRGFLGSILAAAVAPAIVRADSLMRMVPTETVVLAPPVAPIRAYTIEEMELRIAAAMAALRDRIEADIYSNLCRKPSNLDALLRSPA